MNRRGFLSTFGAMAAAALTLDPEKLLWTPEAKTIFIPKFYETFVPFDPCFSMIDSTNLEQIRRNVVFDNLFLDSPFQRRLRSRAIESLSGGTEL